jgi:predicted DNA-binding protein (MmcQ/YjbR family)
MKWIQRYSADTLSDDDLKAYIEGSYRLVAEGLTKKLQRELGFLKDGK